MVKGILGRREWDAVYQLTYILPWFFDDLLGYKATYKLFLLDTVVDDGTKFISGRWHYGIV